MDRQIKHDTLEQVLSEVGAYIDLRLVTILEERCGRVPTDDEVRAGLVRVGHFDTGEFCYVWRGVMILAVFPPNPEHPWHWRVTG